MNRRTNNRGLRTDYPPTPLILGLTMLTFVSGESCSPVFEKAPPWIMSTQIK